MKGRVASQRKECIKLRTDVIGVELVDTDKDGCSCPTESPGNRGAELRELARMEVVYYAVVELRKEKVISILVNLHSS
jgi:hypothetical protein